MKLWPFEVGRVCSCPGLNIEFFNLGIGQKLEMLAWTASNGIDITIVNNCRFSEPKVGFNGNFPTFVPFPF
jgi:hypothetical protein